MATHTEDPTDVGKTHLTQPGVAKPRLLHQDFLCQLIRISRMIKHTHLTTEYSELPKEGCTFKMQWKYWSYSWDLLWQSLTSADVHKKEALFLFSFNCLSPKVRKETYSTCYCMKLSLCNIFIINTSIVSLVIKGEKSLWISHNLTIILGAASW